MSLSVISTPETVMHCGNEISITLATDLAPSTANLSISCTLLVERVYGSTSYDIITSQTLTPDANGDCKFFWDRFLWDVFENAFDLPTVGGTSEYRLENHVKRYKFYAFENSGSPVSQTDVLTTGTIHATRYAVRGGIDKHSFFHNEFFGASGWNMTAQPTGLGMAFLDWRGDEPRTRLTQDQWLHWMWQDPGGVLGANPFDYMVKYYLSDGTSVEITHLVTPTIQPYEVYGFPAGFTQLGLSAYETADVKVMKYETWIQIVVLGTPIPLSEIKTWTVDRAYYEFEMQLQYLNSLGTMEQFCFRGAPTRYADVSAGLSGQYTERSYGSTRGESVVSDRSVDNGVKLTSGPMPSDEKTQMAEILSSDFVFLHNPKRGMYNIPIRILNKKLEYNYLETTPMEELEFVIDTDSRVVKHL